MNLQQRCGKNDEWYTPDYIVDTVRDTLTNRNIKVDLASCEYANSWIKASEYYTLDRPFNYHHQFIDQYWLNPPFSMTKDFIFTLGEIAANGDLGEGYTLVNANTETQFFQYAMTYNDALILLNRRIQFITPKNGIKRGNLKGQAIFYRGKTRLEIIREHWKPLGTTLSLK